MCVCVCVYVCVCVCVCACACVIPEGIVLEQQPNNMVVCRRVEKLRGPLTYGQIGLHCGT